MAQVQEEPKIKIDDPGKTPSGQLSYDSAPANDTGRKGKIRLILLALVVVAVAAWLAVPVAVLLRY